MTRTNRRATFLATTSFVAANILAGAGALTATAFTPSAALAATCDTFNGNISGTVTCDGTAGATVTYTVTANGTVVNPQDVTINDNTANGIAIDAGGFNTALNFQTNSGKGGTGSTVTSTFAGGNGILITNGGNINLTTVEFDAFTVSSSDQTTTITGAASGISITSGGAGTIKATIGGKDTITGNAGHGVGAQSNTGDISISTLAGSTVSGTGGKGCTRLQRAMNFRPCR